MKRLICFAAVLIPWSSAGAQQHSRDRDIFDAISDKYGELNERGEFFRDDGGGSLETVHIEDSVPNDYQAPDFSDIEVPEEVEIISEPIDLNSMSQEQQDANQMEHPFDKDFEDGKYDGEGLDVLPESGDDGSKDDSGGEPGGGLDRDEIDEESSENDAVVGDGGESK